MLLIIRDDTSKHEKVLPGNKNIDKVRLCYLSSQLISQCQNKKSPALDTVLFLIANSYKYKHYCEISTLEAYYTQMKNQNIQRQIFIQLPINVNF